MIIGSRALLAERARAAWADVELRPYLSRGQQSARSAGAHRRASTCRWRRPAWPGRLDPANARHVLALLDRAIDGCVSGEFAAMVTAPVQKSVINDAGVPFTGHTEYLADAHRRRASGDAAGRRRPARGARDHAPAAARGQRRHHA